MMKRSTVCVGLLVSFVCGFEGHALAQEPPLSPSDEWLLNPIDDRTFETFLDFFTYDSDLSFDVDVMGEEDVDGIKREHLSFQTTRDERVFAYHYEPAVSVSGPRPAVIVLHGGSVRAKDSAGSQLFGRLFARAGWQVLAIDMKYHGERRIERVSWSSGQEKHDVLYNQPALYLEWMVQNARDVGRSLDLLIERYGADPQRIALVGLSRGAIVSAVVGAVERRVAAVVMSYGAHFDRLERRHLPAACPANYIGRISPRPLLMLNGLHDGDMHKENQVEPLYALAREPRQISWADTGHTSALTEEHRAFMLQWLKEILE